MKFKTVAEAFNFYKDKDVKVIEFESIFDIFEIWKLFDEKMLDHSFLSFFLFLSF